MGPISYEEARAAVLDAAKRLRVEPVPLAAALGRTLARDIRARGDVPPFAKATMDGYAVRAEDTRPAAEGVGVVLEVIEDLAAGRRARRAVGPGLAVRIMTGAPLPRGADAVVMVESTEKIDDGARVRVLRPVRPGENTGQPGEDLRKGDVVVSGGSVIGPAETGLLAAAGLVRVPVVRRPRVAVLSTGDELARPGQRRGPGMIRDANGPALLASALRAGADAVFLGIARDSRPALRAKLRKAEAADILVLSGGVSVGDHDLVKEELEAFGVSPVFWRVRIKPGKPVFFGRRGRALVFGLPGNPTSALVTFHLFVRPAIEKMLGRSSLGPRSGRAVLLEDLALKPGRTQFLRAVLEVEGPTLGVRPYPDQKSGVLRSMARSQALIVAPPEAERLERGADVPILFLEG